ncbi:hypothetical protein JCM33374_g5261 [Metschnikowia sp. JCM 33374]|nr:hypothetical protein JCM33374_g5261 [Metschnikowia sp. JCM 33374]
MDLVVLPTSVPKPYSEAINKSRGTVPVNTAESTFKKTSAVAGILRHHAVGMLGRVLVDVGKWPQQHQQPATEYRKTKYSVSNASSPASTTGLLDRVAQSALISGTTCNVTPACIGEEAKSVFKGGGVGRYPVYEQSLHGITRQGSLF